MSPERPPLPRRRFVATSARALGIPAALAACLPGPAESRVRSPRLTARPRAPTRSATPGAGSTLGLEGQRDGLLYVPGSNAAEAASPLLVVLHGAGGGAAGWDGLYGAAEGRGFALLVPESRGRTWDAIRGGFGADVDFVDRALSHTFDRVHVDPERICLAGFSDGGSYALSLGSANGDLFTHLVGWSPGFLIPAERVGLPPVYVSHGMGDTILPVTLSRDRIVPTLRDRGYDVTYREFDGGHTLTSEIVTEALDWFL